MVTFSNFRLNVFKVSKFLECLTVAQIKAFLILLIFFLASFGSLYSSLTSVFSFTFFHKSIVNGVWYFKYSSYFCMPGWNSSESCYNLSQNSLQIYWNSLLLKDSKDEIFLKNLKFFFSVIDWHRLSSSSSLRDIPLNCSSIFAYLWQLKFKSFNNLSTLLPHNV